MKERERREKEIKERRNEGRRGRTTGVRKGRRKGKKVKGKEALIEGTGREERRGNER